MYLIIDIFLLLYFFSSLLASQRRKKDTKKRRKDALFSTSSLRSAVFFCSAKAESLMLAIALRARSQFAERCLSEASLRG